MKSFANRVAAVTGAASGIGRALALQLAREGCQLALCDINAAPLAETARQARAYGVKVTTAELDVGNREQMQAWAAQVVKEHGKVNLVFNNAGVAHAGTVEGTEPADYQWIMDINFWGVVHGTQAFLPHLKAAGEGHIVNISSVFGLFAQPAMSAYNATKFAVRGFTESLRQELDLMGAGVSATCVHPGGIKTGIAKSARMSRELEALGAQAGSADGLRERFHSALLRTPPEKAAQVILKGVRRNRRRVLIGSDARAADLMQRLLPGGYQRLVTLFVRLVGKLQVGTQAVQRTP